MYLHNVNMCYKPCFPLSPSFRIKYPSGWIAVAKRRQEGRQWALLNQLWAIANSFFLVACTRSLIRFKGLSFHKKILISQHVITALRLITVAEKPRLFYQVCRACFFFRYSARSYTGAGLPVVLLFVVAHISHAFNHSPSRLSISACASSAAFKVLNCSSVSCFFLLIFLTS